MNLKIAHILPTCVIKKNNAVGNFVFLLSFHKACEFVCRLFANFFGHMVVDQSGCLIIAVAKSFLNLLKAYTGCCQQGSMRVSELVW